MTRTGHDTTDTQAMALGRAVHMLALEPQNFNQTFVVQTESYDRRTKVGKEAYELFLKEACGRSVLRLEDFQQISNMADAISTHPIWSRFKGGSVEHSIYWDHQDSIRLRSRPDYFTDDIIIDLKTTSYLKGFDKSVFRYGYHRQAAMQLDGLAAVDGRQRKFVLFTIEKEAPYLTSVFALDEASIEEGRRDYHKAAELYAQCLEFDIWPGYSESVQTIAFQGDLNGN
jgi:exodeoxyribonuclease VIII